MIIKYFMDKILQRLILDSDERQISKFKKEFILSNWRFLNVSQKKNLLKTLDRSGLYERALLKLDLHTQNLINDDE